MNTVSRSTPDCSPAQIWFDRHLPELLSRCNAYFHFLPPVEREEAVAETLAAVVQYVASADRRGRLARLTPFTMILYFGRLCRAGRRMAGTKTTDAMSEAAQRRGHHYVYSLSDSVPIANNRGKKVAPLWQVLADQREDSPFENCRRNVDYPAILDKENVGAKGRRVFQFMCETHGQGSHRDLARELGVSAGRISQIKNELASSLDKHGYRPHAA